MDTSSSDVVCCVKDRKVAVDSWQILSTRFFLPFSGIYIEIDFSHLSKGKVNLHLGYQSHWQS